jgi:endonuclease/exonuclease/phosphatase family metal-dependent hydrolase
VLDKIRLGLCFLPLFTNTFIIFRVGRISVATYNVWNTMFHWDLRKIAIAKMIRSSNVDIVGFQELRARYNNDGFPIFEQLSEIKMLLLNDGFKYDMFAPAGVASDGSIEGVGILSKYPFLDSQILNLTRTSEDVDTNDRSVLRVTIGAREEGDEYPLHQKRIDIIVAHLSYAKHQVLPRPSYFSFG